MDTPLPKPRLTTPLADARNSAIYFGALAAADSVIFFTFILTHPDEIDRAKNAAAADEAWARLLNFCAIGAYTEPANMLRNAAGIIDRKYRPALPTTLAELPARLAAHNAAAKASRRAARREC